MKTFLELVTFYVSLALIIFYLSLVLITFMVSIFVRLNNLCLFRMSGFDFDLGIIGAGQMGYAIAEGAIKAGVVKNVLATRPSFKNPKICEKWEAIGAKCSVDNTEGEFS